MGSSKSKCVKEGLACIIQLALLNAHDAMGSENLATAVAACALASSVSPREFHLRLRHQVLTG